MIGMVGRSVGRWVGGAVGRSGCRAVLRSVGRWGGRAVGWSGSRAFGRPGGQPVGRSSVGSVGPAFWQGSGGRVVARTVGRAVSRLAQELAARKDEGPFDQVINAIEKMIFHLKDEQRQEDDHKNWCALCMAAVRVGCSLQHIKQRRRSRGGCPQVVGRAFHITHPPVVRFKPPLLQIWRSGHPRLASIVSHIARLTDL